MAQGRGQGDEGMGEEMNELFPPETVQMESPRLKWIARYGIRTIRLDYLSKKDKPWSAWIPEYDDDNREIVPRFKGYGETEDDALADLAKTYGIRLWNEEVA